jgi:hypothetical protein
MLSKNNPWSKLTSIAIEEQCFTWRTSSYCHPEFILSNISMTHDKRYRAVAFEWMSNDTHHQDWLWDIVMFKRCSHIIILGYPLNMVMTPGIYDHIVALEWILKRCTPLRVTMGPSTSKPKMHLTAWIWVINITEDAYAFHFTIWLHELRGIHWEQHRAYNKEPFTASYETHV